MIKPEDCNGEASEMRVQKFLEALEPCLLQNFCWDKGLDFVDLPRGESKEPLCTMSRTWDNLTESDKTVVNSCLQEWGWRYISEFETHLRVHTIGQNGCQKPHAWPRCRNE